MGIPIVKKKENRTKLEQNLGAAVDVLDGRKQIVCHAVTLSTDSPQNVFGKKNSLLSKLPPVMTTMSII